MFVCEWDSVCVRDFLQAFTFFLSFGKCQTCFFFLKGQEGLAHISGGLQGGWPG